MQKYLEIKEEYSDCILFYRLGDFYEMFFEDAKIASKELELTLTGKQCGLEERAPMCGVPYHAVEGFLNKLISKGYKVAICEQVEDPKLAKGLVKREVTRIVTPGTNLDMQALDDSRNNYLMCIAYIADRSGLSVCDVTTGQFTSTEVDWPENCLMKYISILRLRSYAMILFLSAVLMSKTSNTGYLFVYIPWKPGISMMSCARGRLRIISALIRWDVSGLRMATAG